MNKLQLIQKMSEMTDLTQTDCKIALEAFMKIVLENLKNHEETALMRFGTFSILKKKSREGINPATKKRMVIPEQYIPKFKPTNSIKKLPKK